MRRDARCCIGAPVACAYVLAPRAWRKAMLSSNRWQDRPGDRKYPPDQKHSAVMAALTIAQDEHGHLNPQLMDFVAEYLEMPPIAVYEVASFYEMYDLEPAGKLQAVHLHQPALCAVRRHRGGRAPQAQARRGLERDHRRRPLHAQGRRVLRRLRRRAGHAGEQQDHADRHDAEEARQVDRGAATSDAFLDRRRSRRTCSGPTRSSSRA